MGSPWGAEAGNGLLLGGRLGGWVTQPKPETPLLALCPGPAGKPVSLFGLELPCEDAVTMFSVSFLSIALLPCLK